MRQFERVIAELLRLRRQIAEGHASAFPMAGAACGAQSEPLGQLARIATRREPKSLLRQKTARREAELLRDLLELEAENLRVAVDSTRAEEVPDACGMDDACDRSTWPTLAQRRRMQGQ